jgi:hypothetical protein
MPCRAHDPSTIPHPTVHSSSKVSQDDYSAAVDLVFDIDHLESCTCHEEFRFDGRHVFLLLEFLRRSTPADDLTSRAIHLLVLSLSLQIITSCDILLNEVSHAPRYSVDSSPVLSSVNMTGTRLRRVRSSFQRS